MYGFLIAYCFIFGSGSKNPLLSITQLSGKSLDQELRFQVAQPSPLLQAEALDQKGMKNNQEKFSALRQLNLPDHQYAIIGSGPLGIRNLKSIGDIDILVTPKLFDDLAAKYGITDENGVKKIVIPGGIIEAFQEGSFYAEPFDNKSPSIASRIAHAEMIEGLPFDAIENTLYYKRKSQREKDLKDIPLIEEWMKTNKKPTDQNL